MLIAEDAHHGRARELFARANLEQWRLITTNAVTYETYAVLLRRARHPRRACMTFLDLIAAGSIPVERVTPADEARAQALLRHHEDKSYSYCDASSFAMMERLRITDAIAFDRHFREYGHFTIL